MNLSAESLREYAFYAKVYAGAIVAVGFTVVVHAVHSRTNLPGLGCLVLIAALGPLIPFMWVGRSKSSRQDHWRYFWTRPGWWKLGWLGILGLTLALSDVRKYAPHQPGEPTQLLGLVLVFCGYTALDSASVVEERAEEAEAKRTARSRGPSVGPMAGSRWHEDS